MTAEEHIIAWIESSGPHYAQLLEIHRRRQPGCRDCYIHQTGLAAAAFVLVRGAYSEMVAGGDARRDDEYSAAEILNAAAILTKWEAPE